MELQEAAFRSQGESARAGPFDERLIVRPGASDASGQAGTGEGARPSGRSEMLREELLKPDLLSEIVLLGSGALLFASLLLIVVTAITRA
jgi:hypothetical protein